MPITPTRHKIGPAQTRLPVRVDLPSGARFGPARCGCWKVDRTGSISAAARAMHMAMTELGGW